MNNKLLIGIWLCIAMSGTVGAQDGPPGIKWQQTIGGFFTDGQGSPSAYDTVPRSVKSLVLTRDHGFIVGGLSGSNDGYMAGNRGYSTPWTAKFDSSRNWVWSNFPGTPIGPNIYGSVIQANGNGYIVTACTKDGHDSAYQEDNQLLIVRLAEDGTVLWEKKYGGTGADRGYSIQKNGNSGYLIAGSSSSQNETAPSPWKGGHDIWLVSIDNDGNLLWEKKFGGTANEYGMILRATANGDFILGGFTRSNDGDFTGAKGGDDIIIMRVDPSGNRIWTKRFGGTGDEKIHDISQDMDGGFVFVGETSSTNGDVTGNHGNWDAWVVKLNPSGNILWNKTLGGTWTDQGTALTILPGPYYIVGGSSASVNGDFPVNKGLDDAFLAKLDVSGNILWSTTYGGSGVDEIYSIIPGTDDELVILGETSSTNGDVSGTKGYSDLWLFTVGSINKFEGRVFYDMNSNGMFDSGEKNAENVRVVAESNGIRTVTSSLNGNYRIIVGQGNYSLVAELSNSYYTVVPAVSNANFSSYFKTETINLALQPVPGKSDLDVSILPIVPARPGFNVSYQVAYNNKGTQALDAVIQLKPDSRQSFISANPAPVTTVGGTITWSIPALGPNTGGNIFVNLTIAPPPSTNNGDTLRISANISPLDDDGTPIDNVSNLNQVVTGSYDPNDKQESNGGVITPGQVTAGEALNYLIRFQNTGTDTAFTIVVRDTLPGNVIPSTLQIIRASHPYHFEQKNDRQLTWTFNDILLVDSNMNEPLSHGYIAYKIKPIPELAVGDTVFNSASIYFDYNLPVITNNEFTVVKNLLALPVKLSYFRGLRAGEENRLFWENQTQSHFSHFELERSGDGRLFVNLGKIPLNRDRKYRYEYIDAAPLDRVNYYRLKMVDIDGSFEYSPVVLLQYATDAAVSLSVYPNPAQSAFQLDLQGSVNGTVTVRILNQVGHSVKVIQLGKQQANKILIPVSVNHLRKGTYFVQVTVGEQKFVKKMVVQ